MAEYNTNLWAPWRMAYIRSLSEEASESGCFLCRYWADPSADAKNHVLWRRGSCMVCMNRFPYTNGHLLVAHAGHKGDLVDLREQELADLTAGIRDAVQVLRRVLNPQGFNIGYNLGHCAGAGLPDHLHAHVVPRWGGDTNYMAVIGDTRVIPDALDALAAQLVAGAREAGLRS
jgi:ATP adenylyltransferase